jgi:hypothetical protein
MFVTGTKTYIVEFCKHWLCVLTHRSHWFTVRGVLLCRKCDAALIDFIIAGSQDAHVQPTALGEFARGAERGLTDERV